MAEMTGFPISAVLQNLEQDEGIDPVLAACVIRHLRIAGLLKDDRILWIEDEQAIKQSLISEV